MSHGLGLYFMSLAPATLPSCITTKTSTMCPKEKLVWVLKRPPTLKGVWEGPVSGHGEPTGHAVG